MAPSISSSDAVWGGRTPAGLQAAVHVRPVRHELPHELQARQVPGPDGRGIAAVAGVRLAHPRHRVERREAGALIVRIGAGLDQPQRELEVTVADGQRQRAHALVHRPVAGVVDQLGRLLLRPLDGGVHVDAGVEQPLDDLDASLADGEEQAG